MEESRTGLILAAIVSIIAIVGLVLLFNAGKGMSGAAVGNAHTPKLCDASPSACQIGDKGCCMRRCARDFVCEGNDLRACHARCSGGRE